MWGRFMFRQVQIEVDCVVEIARAWTGFVPAQLDANAWRTHVHDERAAQLVSAARGHDELDCVAAAEREHDLCLCAVV